MKFDALPFVFSGVLSAAALPAAAQFHLRTASAEIDPRVDLFFHEDFWPTATGDGAGNWVAIWSSREAGPGIAIGIVGIAHIRYALRRNIP